MQFDLFHCKVTLHVSGVITPIIRSTKKCNRSLRYKSYCEIQGLTAVAVLSAPDDGCCDTRNM